MLFIIQLIEQCVCKSPANTLLIAVISDESESIKIDENIYLAR